MVTNDNRKLIAQFFIGVLKNRAPFAFNYLDNNALSPVMYRKLVESYMLDMAEIAKAPTVEDKEFF